MTICDLVAMVKTTFQKSLSLALIRSKPLCLKYPSPHDSICDNHSLEHIALSICYPNTLNRVVPAIFSYNTAITSPEAL